MDSAIGAVTFPCSSIGFGLSNVMAWNIPHLTPPAYESAHQATTSVGRDVTTLPCV
jgi:hypothetical protein